MQPIKKQEKKYYFSDKLKDQLSQISHYPVTIVEAPGGFGKTTAVREYLQNEFPRAICEWYTCMGESAPVSWAGICELFAGTSCEAANGMRNFKLPSMDTLFFMKVYLKNLKCRKKTYLIIDNYHLMSFDIHRELISFFSMHTDHNLHMIFLMQQLSSRGQLPAHNDNIYTIDSSAFFFDREDILSLFRMEGFRLTREELDSIFGSTGGWISAICLQLTNYKGTGSLALSSGTEQLVETAIWNRLMPIEKDFLLSVSVFDSFTVYQAAGMLNYEVLPGKIEERLRASDFIRFLPDKHLFTIHSILLDYLRNRFYYHHPKVYQNRLFYKAGVSCVATRQYFLATKFFYKIKDFDAIMSLPFTSKYLDAQKEEYDEDLFLAILRECPEEILCKYPSTMVTFAHYLLLNSQYGLYERLRDLLRILVRENTSLAEEEIKKLSVELILLECTETLNDLPKIRDGYRQAYEIWGDSSEQIENIMPWLPIFPTTVGMFWSEPGKLDETFDLIDETKNFYRKFSGGRGAGLGHVMQAEVLLLRGEDNEAEIFCHKAIYEARAFKQDSICIYAQCILARVFIFRGDAEGFFTATENIQKYGEDCPDRSVRRMMDLCMSTVNLLLGIKEHVSPWLYNIDCIRKSLYAPVVPFAEIMYLTLLLADKRYNELYAVGQIALGTLRDPDSKHKYLMPQIYYLILLAVGKYESGNDTEARKYLREALGLALPDKAYIMFAGHECMEDMLSGLDIGEEGSSFMGQRDALIKICKRHRKGVNIIRKALLRNKSPLTPREREIALLAKERMSAREIAEELHISDTTVRSTLRNVYSKLDIHSRSELSFKEF